MKVLKMVEQRNNWNDDRLDALAKDVKDGFARVDQEMKADFDKVDERFDKVDERFEKIDEKFERLYRMLFAGLVVILGALVGVSALGG